MENTVNRRVEELIGVLKLSHNAFAKSIGKTSTTINQIVSGRNNPSFDVLDAICSTYPKINPAWLLRGDGDIWLNVPDEKPNADSSYLQDYLEKLEEQFKRVLNQLETKDHQIENLQQMLMKTLGKHRGVMFLTSRNIFLEAAELEAAARA